MTDANKGIASITYNSLNLPALIAVTGKGTIRYSYGADGTKFRKIVVDSTANPVRTIKTDYVNGLVYLNDTLQYIPHEEGRIRPVYKANAPVGYAFDYFVKDHLGNVRLVLTDQTDFSMYAATMEVAAAPKETALFSNIDNTRTAKPAGYPVDPGTGPNESVALLNAKTGGKKMGPSLVLRVMAGDTINIGVKAFYKSQGTKQAPKHALPEDMIAALALNFGGVTSNGGMHGVSMTEQGPLNANFYHHEYQQLKKRDTDPTQNDRPRAYLNYALFDDRLSMIDENSGVKQVKPEPDQLQVLGVDKAVMQKSGFLYVYTSNETQQDVFFDNLIVTKSSGPVLEETHYYPEGLVMDGISYRAYSSVDNRVLFQGKELQHNEFSDGSGLEWYDFDARYYDPQLGRWFSPDPAGQDWSPYMAMGNRPVIVRDPDGRFWHIVIGAVIGGTFNLVRHAGQIHSFRDGLVAFGIGAAAGAIGAATGGAALAELGLASSTFLGGAIEGAIAGGVGSAVEGVGNNVYFGDPFSTDNIYQAAAFGAATGGIMGGASGAGSGKTGWDLVGVPRFSSRVSNFSLSLAGSGRMADPVYADGSPIPSGGSSVSLAARLRGTRTGNGRPIATMPDGQYRYMDGTPAPSPYTGEGASGDFVGGPITVNIHPELAAGSAATKTGMTDLQLVTRAAQKAETAIGGTGRFAGTAKHTYANNLLSRYQSIYGNRGLQFNQYFNGPAGRGFLDVVNHRTMTIYDYKFGSAVMGNSQFLKYSNSFPGYGIQIIRP